ncbi:GGDEF domain-containing protein [Actinomadura sp. 6K520]|jgi:diguanylate cyclase (GGDEF)-like protein|uniref:sensor domain-containing diguanylate cyclase n=1 Tax=Actinomadura sp. 6K520 TaxID=2530364 RepID=UPI00104F47DB|nr:GGDEF domain-containing protein [Actinomadura sp. 6K520]TDE31076.1 GGDEF domain-containing protein [Actinomadura sp. 6K520]
MTAVQSSAEDRGGELAFRPRRRTLLGRPSLLVIYVPVVVAAHLGLAVAGLLSTPLRTGELTTFAALLACGAVCIEATRRLGMPAGVARDLLSAWWLPVALLLPPVYALLIPLPVQALLQFRVRRTLVYRRALVAAAHGIAGACASLAFHQVVRDPLEEAPQWVVQAYPGIVAAVGCAALFTVVNTAIVAVAAHAASPESRWRDVLWTRENLLLDLVELCVGILVAITCALSLGLLILALPPLMLLQRSLMHQQLQAAARTDAKTGLLNAAAWQMEADTELSRAQRTHGAVALLLIDIDHFKRVNDTHGHLMGDQVLVGVASTLCHQLRDYDVVGRFGGEEFVVLLPGADTVEACRVAERLRGRVRRLAVPAEEGTVTVTVSVGVALFRTHGQDLLELLASADLALYRAKSSGRDRVCLPAVDGPRPTGT